MTIYLVYKTTNLSNGKYYIGKHKCQSLNDGYLGSGTALKEAINKYGRDNFVRETLATFDTEEEAFQYEQNIVNPNDPLCYNIKTGGLGGHTHSKKSREMMSKNMKGRTPWNKGKTVWSDSERRRIGELSKGRPQTDETKRKRVEARSWYKPTEEHKAKTSAKLKGRVFSDETRKKMSEAAKRRKKSVCGDHTDS